MQKSHLIIYILACLVLTACSLERAIKKGDQHLSVGEYYDAAVQYRKAYQQTPTKLRRERGLMAVKMARCYAKINQTQRAISAFQNAIRYEQATLNDKLIYAQLLLKDGQYKAAEKAFLALKDSLPNDTLILNGLASARQAPAWKKQGSKYIVRKMDVFNSYKTDYSPAFYGPDHNILYFTSTRKEASGDELNGITGMKNGDIFYSERNDKGKWSKPEPIGGELNSTFDEGACAFSPDERTMYLTQCSTDPVSPRYARLMTSSRSDASWTKPTELPISHDTLSLFAHPAVSPDGNWLYFTSDMPGGKGGLDLWRVRITAAGLGGVENLGAPINTAGNEEFPSFRPNGDLYFSSNGHAGMGGLDIYIAHFDSQGKATLSHPGYPLNSNADDFGMTFEGPHNRGYFSSNRNDSRGYDHIYSFEYPEIVQTVKGWVYEKDGYELPRAQVYMVGNDGTNLKLSVRGDGSFTETVKPGVDYIFLATCDGFLNHHEALNVHAEKASKEYVLQFPLASITAPVLIDNIFYDFNKATLRPESTAALDDLVALLNENPHVTIEISAHCDFRGSAEYNLRLSQQRAENVVRYLISKGISADRLTAVGYGKQRPKVIRKKLTEKYTWLKEGDKLTSSFIEKLNKEQQEICNQLNRRTEFSVLRTTYGMFDKDGKLKKEAEKIQQKKENETPDIYF